MVRVRVFHAIKHTNRAAFNVFNPSNRLVLSARRLVTQSLPVQCSHSFSTTASQVAIAERINQSHPDEERLVFASVEQLKSNITAPQYSFKDASHAYTKLREQGVKLREKHYLSLIYKASREGKFKDVDEIFRNFCDDEKQQRVLLPPRADRTWNYLSLERQQMHRFVLWALLDSHHDRKMTTFYRKFVQGQPNRLSVFESDPLNFLLRMECTGKFSDEEEVGLKVRIKKLLDKMELCQIHASYSSSHALFRFMLYHPEIFLNQDSKASREGEKEADSDNEQVNVDGSIATVFLNYLDQYKVALRRDPKRLSIAVSAAAAAGQDEVAKSILKDAAHHRVSIDSVSFAHAVECAENETTRMEFVDLYMTAKDKNAVYTTQDAPTSVSNYLLLYAIYDGNFKHMMELLHEMRLYNNKASNKTVEELFQSIAEYRAKIRQTEPEKRKMLAECPTILELFNTFTNVIPRTVHTVSQGILQSLRAGDMDVALVLLRTTIWSTEIVFRPEIYAQVMYPLLADVTGLHDALDLVEVEKFFDQQHPKQRAYVNAQVLNICESNDDLTTMMTCLDRWQLQNHSKLSRRALQRVFDVISKHLSQLLAQDPSSNVKFYTDGTQLSYRAFLERYNSIISWDAWTIGNAIIRSGTSGLHDDVCRLLVHAHAETMVLEKTAYKISLEVLQSQGKHEEIAACAQSMQHNGSWDSVVQKYPHLVEIVAKAIESQ